MTSADDQYPEDMIDPIRNVDRLANSLWYDAISQAEPQRT